jgi:hypothetical protein
VVHRNWARFSFPRLEQDGFVWWTPVQRTQLTTYSWSVLVRGQADTAFSAAYWLPAIGLEPYDRWYAERRPLPVGTQHGSLADLLRAGMQDVQVLEGHVGMPLPRLAAHVTAAAGRVIIELRGAATVRRLFAVRPSHVAFYAYLPGEPPRVAQVPVVYVDH